MKKIRLIQCRHSICMGTDKCAGRICHTCSFCFSRLFSMLKMGEISGNYM